MVSGIEGFGMDEILDALLFLYILFMQVAWCSGQDFFLPLRVSVVRSPLEAYQEYKNFNQCSFTFSIFINTEFFCCIFGIFFEKLKSNIVRQAERADFSELMICQIFSTAVKKTLGGSELYSTIVKFCHNSQKIGTSLNSLQTL